MGIICFEALDHHLALTLNCVNHQGSLTTTFGFNQKGDTFDWIGLGCPEVQDSSDIHQWCE